jgi:hypothetical protein
MRIVSNGGRALVRVEWMGVAENHVQWQSGIGNSRVKWEWLRTVSNGRQALVTAQWNENG